MTIKQVIESLLEAAQQSENGLDSGVVFGNREEIESIDLIVLSNKEEVACIS